MARTRGGEKYGIPRRLWFRERRTGDVVYIDPKPTRKTKEMCYVPGCLDSEDEVDARKRKMVEESEEEVDSDDSKDEDYVPEVDDKVDGLAGKK